jgi:Ca-activated chloride channel homolog
MSTNMLRLVLCALMAAIVCSASAVADGVMRPSAKTYPKDFLRHRMTKVDVTLHGQVAVTTVYQEFVNEWHLPTDAVYSFPLPVDARATDFLFWYNDTLYRAPLKVKEQAPNPGTGEGGVDAQLTNYLGPNGIRVLLSAIQPGQSQRVILQYISLCRFDQGKILYRYPLNTDLFLTFPIDEFSMSFHVNATDDITAIDAGGFGGTQIRQTDTRHADVTVNQSKVYLTSDLTFSYTTGGDTLAHDFYASKSVVRGGHFVLVLKSKTVTDTSASLPKNVVFMIDRSASAAGAPLEMGRDAIKDCLDRLQPRDRFNVIAYSSSTQLFRTRSVPATVSARDSAKSFLAALTATGYSNLGTSLQSALATFVADSMNSAMIIFSDGMSPVTPGLVKGWNTTQVALFPVAISLAPGTARLEALAYGNFGFPLYLRPTDPVVTGVRWLFDQVNAPIMKDTRMEMGPNAYDFYPRELHTVYGGSRFFLTGRYKTGGTTGLTIAGQSAHGPTVYSAFLQFPADSTAQNFAEKFWAKEKIDELERQILLSGATDSVKQLLINISLSYGIRCMYTAYVADKSQPMTDVAEPSASLQSFSAAETAGGIALSWTLLNSKAIREINVLRAEERDGEYVRINTAAIEGNHFVDRDGKGDRHWYRLEIITTEGERILSAPIPALGAEIPGRTELLQNYPNPFNPTTTIGFTVAGATIGSGSTSIDNRSGSGDRSQGSSFVTLVVYDMLGREVRTLKAEYVPAGTYRVQWDGVDQHGLPVAAGFYVYRLSVGAHTEARTMILIR